MQHCCTVGLKRSRKARMPFRKPLYLTTPRGKNTVQLLATLLDADCRWTVHELAAEVGVCHKTVCHILHDILGYLQTFSTLDTQWKLWGATMAPLCSHTELVDWYQRKGNDFLGWNVAMDKTWACSYKSNLKRQSNEWKHPSSPRPKKVHPTQCAVKVMFIVVYDIDGLILHRAVPPRQMVNAAYYCTFLQHHLRPVLRRKWHLVVQNPIILHDNASS